MTDPIILDAIPFVPDIARLFNEFRIKPGSGEDRLLMRLGGEAQSIARPRAIYRVSGVEARDGDSVTIDGVVFQSTFVAEKLGNASAVYPYIATSGAEINGWQQGFTDTLASYYALSIVSQALDAAFNAVCTRIQDAGGEGKLGILSPGSLPAWPLAGQRELLGVMGADAAGEIGVRLADTNIMTPSQTVSGLIYLSDTPFVSCELCDRKECARRRAPFQG